MRARVMREAQSSGRGESQRAQPTGKLPAERSEIVENIARYETMACLHKWRIENYFYE